MRCIVPGCNNSCMSARFHSFPLNDGALCRTWLRSVQHPVFGVNTDLKVVGQQRLKVCSDHFVAADYNGSYLKDDAVPTVFPWTGIRVEMLCQSVEETSDKEDSPVPTCSQIKEDPADQAVKITPTAEESSIFKSSKVMVNAQCLPELFKCCSVCLVECCVTTEGNEKLFAVIQDCQSCGHHREWKSHPTLAEELVETDSMEHEDHEEHFHEEQKDQKEASDKHRDACTSTNSLVEHTPKLEEDDIKTSDKEDSPVPTCSQIKEEPADQAVKITPTAEESCIFKSSEVMVNAQCLLELFKCCSVCLFECCVTTEGNEKLFAVIQDCQSCGHHREWKSHPTLAEEQKDHKEASDKHRDACTATNSLVEHTPKLEEDDIKTVVVLPHRSKSKEMSMDRKQTIVSLRNQKKSIREIGEILGLSKSTVAYILRKNASTGDVSNKKRSGRPKKTTVEDDQIILSIMEKNPRTPVQQIRNTLKEVGREVSMTTIRRKLHLLNHTIESAFIENMKKNQ